MTLYSHDIAPALAAHAGLKAAYEQRLAPAREALVFWLQSPSPDFAAVRRSIEAEHDLAPAREVAAHLTKNTTDVVLLGIGGSSLGAQTLAGLAAWGTPAYAPAEGRPRLHILDNLDGSTFAGLLRKLDLRTTRFLAVSKSGSTTEPLMHMLAAIEALEAAGGGKYLKHHFAGITEERANPLRAILSDIGAPILAHDPNLGGRYSVLSAVGLLPALLLGLDADAIRKGARAALSEAVNGASPAIEGAALGVAARDVGLSQSVMWVYADRLERLPKWWRQLWAESLGKAGQGTTPIDALGPVDQHSQLQLYLDGPHDKLFTLIDAKPALDAKANAAWAAKHGLSLYAGRSMFDVVAAQARATADTLNAHGRPARRLSLAAFDEPTLGALLVHFILETLIAARLWNVDPFGQPAVEEGKALTRQYLSGRS
jgi:glucose-6-phosphate isomerase